MNRGYIVYWLVNALLSIGTVCRAEVVVNEIMQSNIWTVMDDLDEYPDSYIELYNNGNESVSTRGWRVGESKTAKEGYRLPDGEIKAKGHLLIYCDKEAKGWHTDFRLDSGKGEVYVFDERDSVVCGMKYKKQAAPDIAYGRDGDGGEKWGYMTKASPGKSNRGVVTECVSPKVEFSEDGGMWTEGTREPFYVRLSAGGIGDGKIRYTTDGTEPNEKSILYNKGIYVGESVAIKAKAFKEGCAERPADVRSYIWHPKDVHFAGISLVCDPELFYGEKGLYTLNSVDWVSSKARRAVNMEYFPSPERKGQRMLNQICEANVAGFTSTFSYKLKTLTLRAHKRFGEKSFGEALWAEHKPNVKGVKSFKIRACNQGTDGMNEVAILETMKRSGLEMQASDNVMVYLNGKRYGFMYLQEPKGEDYFVSNYGREDVDVIKYTGGKMVVSNGDDKEYNRFREFYQTPHTLAEWDEVMDLDKFTKQYVIETYISNIDFFTNNIEYFRYREEGAKWMPFVYDVETAFYHVQDAPFLPWTVENDEEHGGFHTVDNDGIVLWRNLLASDGYDEYFIRRSIAMHGDYMNAESLMQRYDSIRSEAEEELQENVWQYGLVGTYSKAININIDKIKRRNDFWAEDVRRFFGLGDVVKVYVNSERRDGIKLMYDSVPLVSSYFGGADYAGRVMRVSAEFADADEGEAVNWVRMVKYAGYVSADYIENCKEVVMTIPEGALEIVLNPIKEREIEEKSEEYMEGAGWAKALMNKNAEIYDMLGRMVRNGKDGKRMTMGYGIYVIIVDGKSYKLIIE